jgi:hypothetical protein
MERTVKGENRESKSNGRSAPAPKDGGTLGSRRIGRREPSSVRSTNSRLEDLTEGQGDLHQRIAERAFFLYERSGFQHGKDLEHWLEAEQQVKGVRGQAA